MPFSVFMQQTHDSNWVPFFTENLIEAQTLAEKLVETADYTAYYIGEILQFSIDYHSEEF